MNRLIKVSVFILIVGSIIFANIQNVNSSDKFPQKPIRIVVPYGAGGTTDLTTRALADVANKYLGISFIVVNKSGAGGVG